MALPTSRGYHITKRRAHGANNSAPDGAAIILADYRALIHIAARINSEQNLDRLLEAITTEANILLDADRSSLYLLDVEHGEYYTKTALGVEGELRFDLRRGIAGTVIREGRPINTRDAEHDTRVITPPDYRVHTLLTVPMITHNGKTIGAIQAFNKRGGVFSGHDEEVLTAFACLAAVALDNAQLRYDIQRMVESFADTLTQAIDARDVQTAGHSRRVAHYAREIAREMGYDSQRQQVVYFAAMLHDIGKIGVPEGILTKPGALDDDEICYMRAHVIQTYDILSRIRFTEAFRDVPAIAGQHHERLNGQGYPNGLTADQIRPEAKILAVADVYDALSVRRYYRSPMRSDEALDYLHNLIGQEFDAACVEALTRVVTRLGPPPEAMAVTLPMRKLLLDDRRVVSVPLDPHAPLMRAIDARRYAGN